MHIMSKEQKNPIIVFNIPKKLSSRQSGKAEGEDRRTEITGQWLFVFPYSGWSAKLLLRIGAVGKY